MNKILSIPIILGILVQTSCSNYDREEFRLVVGEKYALQKWPDSAYIDTLDVFLEKEPVKYAQKQKVEMTMNMNNVMKLPKRNETPAKSTEKPRSAPASPAPASGSESFPDKFFYALNKLSENPGNREYGKKHSTRSGETLDDLLLRVYGPTSRRIPKYLSESMIKQLNPGVDFESLTGNESVLLPIVK